MLICATGFESESQAIGGAIPGWSLTNSNSVAQTHATDYKRSGSYSMKIQNSQYWNNGRETAYYLADYYTPNRRPTLMVGFGHRITPNNTGPDMAYQCRNDDGFFSIGRGGSNYIVLSHYYHPVNTSYQVLAVQSSTTSNIIGYGSSPLGGNTQYYFQVMLTCDATNGAVKVYCGNSLEIDLTGLAFPCTGNYVDQMRFSCRYRARTDNGNSYIWQHQIDDLVIMNDDGTSNNTFPMGIMRVAGTRPSADGDSTDQAASAGNRWDCVDELTATGTDYVQTDQTNKKVYFNFTDVTPTGRIRGIMVLSCLGRSDVGSGVSKVKASYRDISDVEYDNTEYLVYYGTNYSWHWNIQCLDQNPNTAVDQTNQDIYDIQLGVKTTQIE